MWSRGITAIALCVTVVTGTLAALPGPATAGPTREGAPRGGLMLALEQAPRAVTAWKRAHSIGTEPARPAKAGKAANRGSGRGGLRRERGKRGARDSHPNPFGVLLFAG